MVIGLGLHRRSFLNFNWLKSTYYLVLESRNQSGSPVWAALDIGIGKEGGVFSFVFS